MIKQKLVVLSKLKGSESYQGCVQGFIRNAKLSTRAETAGGGLGRMSALETLRLIRKRPLLCPHGFYCN